MPAVFNVQEFKAALGNGGARPNQFMVNIFPPPVLGFPAPQQISMLVSSASLPSQMIGQAIVHYRGREVKMAGDRTFAPWTTTFINDTGLIARQLVEVWMQAMESRMLKTGFTTPDTYYGQLEASQMDRNGGVIRTYTFTDVMPIDISEVPLDYAANDQVSSFQCTWAYQQFLIVGGVDDPVGGAIAAV